MNAQTNPTPTPQDLTLSAMLEVLRRPEVARPLGAALGVANVEEVFRARVYELDRMVCGLRQTAFAMRVLGAGLSTGLDLQEPEAAGIRGLMDGMERPIQDCCDKINGITGFGDY
jgi:hypothetical protein